MPTGYTAELVEKGQPFEKFVLGCARAFGALIDMRDDPMDAEIPDEIKPRSYYQEMLESTKKKLSYLQEMTNEERIAFGKKEKEDAIKYAEKSLEETRQQNSRLSEMEKQVRAWVPPTLDHQGLKDFMLRQISVSYSDEKWSADRLKEAKEKASGSFYSEAVVSAEDSISYYTKQLEQEIVRSKERTEWVKQLKGSLKEKE